MSRVVHFQIFGALLSWPLLESKKAAAMQRSLGALLLVAACGVSDAFTQPPSMVRMSARMSPATAGQFASRPSLALSKTPTPRPLLRVTGEGVELRMGMLSDILVRKAKDVEVLKTSLTDGAKEILDNGIKGKHKHRYLKVLQHSVAIREKGVRGEKCARSRTWGRLWQLRPW